MSVLLVYPNRPRLTYGFLPAPYGLELLRARLESHGLDVRIVDPFLSLDPEACMTAAVDASTTLIGVSVRNVDDALVLWSDEVGEDVVQTVSSAEDLASTLAWCRRAAPAVPIVLGGAVALHMPAALGRRFCTDAAMVVDDEDGFVRRALRASLCAGRARLPRRRRGAPDGPVVRREAMYLRFRHEAAVRTYSGCPLACAHCIEHVGTRRVVRADVERVADELESVVTRHAEVRRVFLADSEVNLVGEARTRALIDAVRARGATREIPITGYFNPRPMSASLVRHLRDRRVKVSLTVDHVADAVLARNGKNFRKRHLLEIVERYRALGLELSFCLLLGQPGETRGTVAEVIDFVARLPEEILGTVHFSPGVRVYPGTPLARALARGELDRRWLVPRARGDALTDAPTDAPTAGRTAGPTGELSDDPFGEPLVYCEGWRPRELFEHVIAASDGRIVPMNAYLHGVSPDALDALDERFRDYHVGTALADSDPDSAWRAWSNVGIDDPFLTPRRRIDLAWERGLAALRSDRPRAALEDWRTLQAWLRERADEGPALDKIAHNVRVAEALAARRAGASGRTGRLRRSRRARAAARSPGCGPRRGG